jgi:hypothetical protein
MTWATHSAVRILTLTKTCSLHFISFYGAYIVSTSPFDVNQCFNKFFLTAASVRASRALADTTVNLILLGLETIDESHVVTPSDPPDVEMIDKPPVVNDTDVDSLETIDELLMAVRAGLPDLGIVEEHIVDKTRLEITANSATNASATVAATTLVTGITSLPPFISPGHGVRPADPLLLRHEAASLTNITNINDHAVVSPHTGTPRHQRKLISIHNGNLLSPPQPVFLDGAADRSAGPFSSPTMVMTQPCLRPQDPLIRASEERLALKEAAAAEMAAAVAASPYHHILPVISQPSRPLYLRALAERAAAEAAAAALTTPTSLKPALVTPAQPPSRRAPKHNKNTMSAMEAPAEETGRRIRRLTVFGEQREKAVEEQKAKAAKAAARKADREKAAHVKVNEERAKSANGAGSKKTAVRGKKGKKRT